MMKILHVVAGSIGGGETYFRNFLATCDDYHLLELTNQNKNIESDFPLKYSFFEKKKGPIGLIKAFFKYLRFLNRIKPDIINAEDPESLGFTLISYYLPFVHKAKKYYYTKHTQKAKVYPVFDFLQQRYFDICQAVICISEDTRKSMEKYHKARFVTIYNGTAFPHAPHVPETNMILSFGRLVHLKGFDLLLTAYASSNFKDNYRLVIFGPGGEKNLEEMIVNTPKVEYLGMVSNKTKTFAELLSSAAVVVLPSRVEGFGYTALEALNFRKKPKTLIVSDIPPFKEILDDLPTFFKSEDVNDLRKKLDYVLANASSFKPDPRKEAILKKFSREKMIAAYLSEYET